MYIVAVRSQSTHPICSSTAVSEPTTSWWSNTPPTHPTNLRVTMQHKSGTAHIQRDSPFLSPPGRTSGQKL